MITDKDLLKISQTVENSLDNRLGAVEQRLVAQFRTGLSATEKRITQDVGALLDDQILPQIEEVSQGLNEVRLLPTVAHELKSKS